MGGEYGSDEPSESAARREARNGAAARPHLHALGWVSEDQVSSKRLHPGGG